uniref:Uncharacterized protein n=1 Tax=Cacopsylla melanoneura TaxID=428564 RepID=A0A8D8M242_9HEMI
MPRLEYSCVHLKRFCVGTIVKHRTRSRTTALNAGKPTDNGCVLAYTTIMGTGEKDRSSLAVPYAMRSNRSVLSFSPETPTIRKLTSMRENRPLCAWIQTSR